MRISNIFWCRVHAYKFWVCTFYLKNIKNCKHRFNIYLFPIFSHKSDLFTSFFSQLSSHLLTVAGVRVRNALQVFYHPGIVLCRYFTPRVLYSPGVVLSRYCTLQVLYSRGIVHFRYSILQVLCCPCNVLGLYSPCIKLSRYYNLKVLFFLYTVLSRYYNIQVLHSSSIVFSL